MQRLIEADMTPQDINATYVADLYGEVLLAEQEATAVPRKRAWRDYTPGLVMVGKCSQVTRP